MMARAVFANVTTTGRRQSLGVELNRHSVGAVIPDDFGRNFRALPNRRRKSMDVGLGFLTGDAGPLASDGGLELFKLGVRHTAPLSLH